MDKNYEKIRLDLPEIKNRYYSKLIGKLLYVSINSIRHNSTRGNSSPTHQRHSAGRLGWTEMNLQISKRHRAFPIEAE